MSPMPDRAPARWWRDGGPSRILAVGARAWWRHWPALVAILLAGELVREVFLRLAGFAATIEPLWGMLLLPFVVLTRLAAIVAMLLVVREAMPAFGQRREGAAASEIAPARFRDALSGSIVAFFVLYAAWGLVLDDVTEYTSSYLEQVDFFALEEGETVDPFALGITGVTVSIILAAFALRFLLKRFASRLPRIADFAAVYLEAVWVFVAVVLLQTVLGWLSETLPTRRVVVWAAEARENLIESARPLRFLIEGWDWLFAQGVEVVAVPLMWLALVGIVYANSLPAPAAGRAPAAKGLGAALRRRVRDLADDALSRWRPVASSARTIWGAGAPTMGFVILLLAVIGVATEWTQVGIWRLAAPQEIAFWVAADRALSLIALVVWEPIRICVLAAAFDTCLAIAATRRGRRSGADGGQEPDPQRRLVGDDELQLS